jgi:hypothetical protein
MNEDDPAILADQQGRGVDPDSAAEFVLEKT